jgi:hypothetical protein
MLASVPPSPEVAHHAFTRKMATQSVGEAVADFGVQLALIRDQLGPDGDELCGGMILRLVGVMRATRRGQRPPP